MPASKTRAAVQGKGQNCAVINPFALAELISGQRIPWKDLPDAERVLEQILATPFDELFDPKFGGPLYLGLKLNEKLELVPARSPLLDYEAPSKGNDSKGSGLENLGEAGSLGDLIKNA